MEKHLHLFVHSALFLSTLTIAVHVSAHASVTAEVPVSKTGFVTISDLVYSRAADDPERNATTGTVVNGNMVRLTSFSQFGTDSPKHFLESAGTFTLVNADTDEDIKDIVNGDVIYLPQDLNVNMRFNPVGTPHSVRFTLHGAKVRTETQAPYAIAGDRSGDYNTWEAAQSGISGAAWPSYFVDGKPVEMDAIDFYFDIVREPVPRNCSASGTILREYWEGIPGNHVSAIPLNSPPTSNYQLPSFEGPTTSDTNYGARIHGYICPPLSGDYTFWIASNDHSELWLSANDDPSNKVMIAHVSGATNPRQWDKFATQKSVAISLIQGKRYYILALHKQGAGTGNLAVGWQLPDGSMERPIPGSRLSPASPVGNVNPVVTIETPASGEEHSSFANINIRANASDEDGEIMMVDFYATNMSDGSVFHLGQDNTAPYSIWWSDVQPGHYTITAEATDTDGGWSEHKIMIEVDGDDPGGISWEYWGGVQGARVSDIPLNLPPNKTGDLEDFEGPAGYGTNYGSRIRGYVTAPATGNYYFSISSNDHSELWLSTDENPGNKVRIAHITGATDFREFDKFSSQRSAAIPLAQGKKYYIEALHKQGVGSDHITVAWRWNDAAFYLPIDGQYLSPFAPENSTSTARAGDTDDEMARAELRQINVYPNPIQSGDRELSVGGFETIRESVATDVEIVNIRGEVVYAEKVVCGGNCGSYVMNINKELVPGLYVIKMNTNGVLSSRRLLVK